MTDINTNTDTNTDTNGCHHYSRKCKIISPCCNKEFTCRFCHDEEEYDNEPNYKLKHKIDRYQIKTIICTNCKTLQPINQYCEKCNICMGNYYCDICHLFDDEDKQQFHCVKCNICRIGGIENYTHCDICNICIKYDINHKCVAVKDSLCPVCMDDLFTSITPIMQVKCGHYMHTNCFTELIKSTYKCPLCSQSLGDTQLLTSYLDQEIEQTPMPPEYNYDVQILCNDCHKESEAKFHIFGMKCIHCSGYNTRRV